MPSPASTYIGKAPLTLVPTVDGTAHYVYRGRPAPEGIVPADLERLLDEGFLEAVGGTYAEAVVDLVNEDPLAPAPKVRRPRAPKPPTAAADGSEGIATEGAAPTGDGPPPKAAAKEAWVDFAVSRRADGVDEDTARAEADGLTKVELIDRFGV